MNHPHIATPYRMANKTDRDVDCKLKRIVYSQLERTDRRLEIFSEQWDELLISEDPLLPTSEEFLFCSAFDEAYIDRARILSIPRCSAF